MDEVALPSDVPAEGSPGRNGSAEVVQEQIRLAYANLPVSQAVALLIGVMLAVVLSFEVGTTRAVGWLAVLVVVTAARVVTAVLYRKAPASSKARPSWRSFLLAGAVASGLTWGSTAFVLYPAESVIHQVLIAFVIGGMVVGAVIAMTPMFASFLLFALSEQVSAPGTPC